MSSGTGFRVDRLRVSYGGQRVLDDTSGTFHAGRMSAIVGPNGAGKSTLVKAMLGLGRVHTNGTKKAPFSDRYSP